MPTSLPRITTRVDEATQSLLSRAAALAGLPSINAFVVNAAVEKARQIIAEDQILRLSETDAATLVNALTHPPAANKKLQAAAARYNNTPSSS